MSQQNVDLVATVIAWAVCTGALALSVTRLATLARTSGSPSSTPEESVAYIEVG